LEKLYSNGFCFLARFIKLYYDKAVYEIKKDTVVFSLLSNKNILKSQHIHIKINNNAIRGQDGKWFKLYIYCKDWIWKEKNMEGTSCYYSLTDSK